MMNFGTLGPRMKMKPEGFLIRSFLTARVTLIMNWATRLRRITITVSCARMPALFMPLTLGLRSVSKSSLAELLVLSEAGLRARSFW